MIANVIYFKKELVFSAFDGIYMRFKSCLMRLDEVNFVFYDHFYP